MADDVKWLIERQIPHLRRFAFALTRDRDLADDLVQDSLERALRKRHLWTRRGSVRSWLFRILYRKNLERLRRKMPDRVAAEQATIDAVAAQPANQDKWLELGDVAKALDRLPPDQRAVILLVALEGLTYDEIAGILDIPIGTVRSRLSRAREALQRYRGPRRGQGNLRVVK